MKKILILAVLASTISCGLSNLFEERPPYIWPENVEELLIGKWNLATLDNNDASQDKVFIEFRADSTFWKYSLLDSALTLPPDSIGPNHWSLDKEAQRLTAGTRNTYHFVIADSIHYRDGWFPSKYRILLITEEKLVIKYTSDLGVGFDPFYGSGGGTTTHRPEETYIKIP